MSTIKFGEFKGKVHDILVHMSERKPAIHTIIVVDPAKPLETITHTVRLDNPDSQRIGFDELRSAFPQELSNVNDEELLTKIITSTDAFIGKDVRVAVQPQMRNNVQVKGPQGQPYFNVRLRSAVRNLDATTASTIARRLLAMSVKTEETEQIFRDVTEGEPSH